MAHRRTAVARTGALLVLGLLILGLAAWRLARTAAPEDAGPLAAERGGLPRVAGEPEPSPGPSGPEPTAVVRLAGTVLAADGSPAAGVAVAALPLEEGGESATAGTDGSGRFSLEGLRPGAHALLARGSEGAGWLPLVRAPSDGIVLRLAPPAFLSGVVVTHHGGASSPANRRRVSPSRAMCQGGPGANLIA